jgi:hypothetical protein
MLLPGAARGAEHWLPHLSDLSTVVGIIFLHVRVRMNYKLKP